MLSTTVEWRSDDLDRALQAGDHGSELQFLVELRGFEPLTPSMRTKRSAVQLDGGPYRLVIEGGSRVRVVREGPADPGVLRSAEPRWQWRVGCGGTGGQVAYAIRSPERSGDG